MITHYQEVRNALDTFGPGAIVTIGEVLGRIDLTRWPYTYSCRLTIVSRHMRRLACEGRVTKISEYRPAKTATQWRVEEP